MATIAIAAPVQAGRRARRRVWSSVAYVILTLVALLAVVPFLWGVTTSLKTARQISGAPLTFVPDPLALDNYGRALGRGLADGLVNSLLVGISSVVLTVLLGSFAGYALARVQFRFANLVLFAIIAPQFVPGLVNLVPTYIIMSKLGLIDTHAVLILLYTVHSLPMAVWITKAFFETIPSEIEQAALVDGCTRWSSLWQIMLPLARPGLAAAALFSFVNSWNEFLIAVTMTSSPGMRTLPVVVYLSITDTGVDWGSIMASATVAVLPVILLFVLLQRQFMSGLTAGALKG
jgi:ABC-type glycerol-3-phosphate transport system permease component